MPTKTKTKNAPVESAEFHIKDFPSLLRKRFVAEASFRNMTTPELLAQVITAFLKNNK